MEECFDIAGCDRKESKLKREVLGIIAVGAALGVLITIVVLLGTITEPEEAAEFCSAPADCEDQIHPECVGEWACANGYCSWECEIEEPAPICSRDSDCEGIPHVMCDGEWSCDDSKCVWACEIGQSEPGLEYEVGECEEGVRKAGEIAITPTADGIKLEQVLDYVCCAQIVLDIERNGNVIRINERNVGEMCRCLCSYDIDAEIKVLPGVYKVEVWGVEYLDEGNNTMQPLEKLGEETVAVGSAIDGVLFIEQHETIEGKIKVGTYPMRFLDSMGYSFDSDRRTLEGASGFGLAGIKAIYGSGVSYSGDAGTGASTRIFPVTIIPATVSGDRITEILDDGTVTLEHAGHTITLAPGESWSETSVEDDAGDFLTGIARITKTDTVTNYGFLEISDINLS